MTFFRWTKYSYIFENNLDSFTLLPLLFLFNFLTKIFFFVTVEILLCIKKYNVYAFFFKKKKLSYNLEYY